MERSFFAVCIRDPLNELVAPECAQLTGGTPDADGIAPCRTIERIRSAAFVREGVEVIAQAATLGDLADRVAAAEVKAEAFRIDVLRLAEEDLPSTREAIVRLADALGDAHPNLDAPRHRFLLVARRGGLMFGEVLVESDRSYRRHDAKPWRTSSSLPSRLARALVNLVPHDTRTVLDPCCGTGSILLEAASLGYEAIGLDRNPKMVGMSRANLAHFGYRAEIVRADARTWEMRADALVTDLPYGRKSAAPESGIRDILRNGARLAPFAVYVAGADRSDWLEAEGYCHVEVFRVAKSIGFARYVHRAWSSDL